MHKRSYVLPATLYVVEDGVYLLVRKRVYTSELRMEIKAVGIYFLFLTIDLIVYLTLLCTNVFNFKSEALEIRHFKIAVHTSLGVKANRKAAYLSVRSVIGVCKKIR